METNAVSEMLKYIFLNQKTDIVQRKYFHSDIKLLLQPFGIILMKLCCNLSG